MPFAGYKDFADCVRKNGDKDDPKAYCGSIQAKAESARTIHSDFQPIRRNFLKQFCGSSESFCETGVRKYNNWKETKNLDDTKPYPTTGEKANFAFLGTLEPLFDKTGKKNLIKFKTLRNSVCTRNLNCYDWNEVMLGFASLQGKPIDFAPWSYDFHGDIHAPRGSAQEVGEVIYARPNPNTKMGEGIGQVSDEVYEMVKRGDITTISIVAASLSDMVDEKGKHVRYPIFTRVALLPKGAIPGDPEASVSVVEGSRLLESWLPVWESIGDGHSHSVISVESARFDGVGQEKEKKQVSERAGGDPVAAQANSSAGASSINDELHFKASKLGPVVELSLSLGNRKLLPETAFADPKNKRFAHHNKDGSIDMHRLLSEHDRASQLGDTESVAHMDHHMKLLEIGPYAVMERGLPSDGKWTPQGFVLQGNRAYPSLPSPKEAWDRYLQAEETFTKVGAMVAGIEDDIVSVYQMSNKSSESVQDVAGIVQSQTVTKAEFESCKKAMEESLNKKLESYVRAEVMPDFVKESVVSGDIEDLEGATRMFRAIRSLKGKRFKPPLSFNLGAQNQKIRAYDMGVSDTVEAALNILREEVNKKE